MFRSFFVASVVLMASMASAMNVDHNTGVLNPGNALVMPFDASSGKLSFSTASNIGSSKVSSHWAFWSESCDHLVDVHICLTQNDTVVVDPTNIRSVDEENEVGGTVTDLSGERGMVIVTALSTNEDCDAPSKDSFTMVDDSLVGSWTIGNTNTSSASGGDALVFGASENQTILPSVKDDQLDTQFFNPSSLQDSSFLILALAQGGGDYEGELAPFGATNKGFSIRSTVSVFDNQEVRTSLPDIELSCMAFSSVIDGIIPGSISVGSSGFVRIEDSVALNSDGEQVKADFSLYTIHGQAVGPYGTTLSGKYVVPELTL